MPKPNPNPPVLTSQDVENFWAKVDKTPGQGPHGECWTRISKKGRSKKYGEFIAEDGRKLRNHRLSYYLTTGEWLADHFGCHSCDWPPCCNPSHIFKGTFLDNNRDCFAKGRHPIIKGSDHCHSELTEEVVKQMRAEYSTHQYSFNDLAIKYGVTQQTAAKAITGRSWKHVNDPVEGKSCTNYGSKVGTSVLTEDQVREIRAMHIPGKFGCRRIARIFGVHHDTIDKIIRRINWKHLKD